MAKEERLLRSGDQRENARHNKGVDYDDYSVRLFPEEAPTEAKRYAANTFVQRLYNGVWMHTGWGKFDPYSPDPDWSPTGWDREEEPTLFTDEHGTAEWVKKRYEGHMEGLRLDPNARDGNPLDPRYTLEHVIGDVLRQIEKTKWLKTQYDSTTVLGRADLQSLDHTEAVYNTMLGLVEQAIQLDEPLNPAPSLPGPAHLPGK